MKTIAIACLTLALFATVAIAGNQPMPNEGPPQVFYVNTDLNEVEPNDNCVDASDVFNIITVDDVYLGGFDPAGDLDYYEVFWPAGGGVIFETFLADGSPVTDTQLTLFADDCLTELAFDDDGGPSLLSRLVYDLEPNTTYYLMVNEYQNNLAGAYIVAMTETPPELIACGDVLDPVCNDAVAGDITGAVDYINELNGGCAFDFNAFGPDLWYNLRLPAGAGFTYELTSFDFGGDALVLFVMEGCEEYSWICHERVWIPSDELNQIAYVNGGTEDVDIFLVISGYYIDTVGTFEGTLNCDPGVVMTESVSFGELKSLYR